MNNPTPRTVKLAIIGAVIIAVGLGTGYWWSQRANEKNGPIVLYGNVDIREVQLAFRQSGRLVELAFDEGDAVTAGARMAALDPQPYRDALAAAEASVQMAQSELTKLRRGLRPQEVTPARESVKKA